MVFFFNVYFLKFYENQIYFVATVSFFVKIKFFFFFCGVTQFSQVYCSLLINVNNNVIELQNNKLLNLFTN